MKVNKIAIITAAFALLFIVWQIGSAYMKNRDKERERIEELQRKKYSDLDRQVDEFFSKGEPKKAPNIPVKRENPPKAIEKREPKTLEPRVYTNEDIRKMDEMRMEKNTRRVVPLTSPKLRLKTLPKFEKPQPDKSNRKRLNGMFKNARDKFRQSKENPGLTTESKSKNQPATNPAD